MSPFTFGKPGVAFAPSLKRMPAPVFDKRSMAILPDDKKILDGKKIAEAMKEELLQEIQGLPLRKPQRIELRVLYFDKPAFLVYWFAQRDAAKRLGIGTGDSYGCPWSTEPKEVEKIIDRWNKDARVHGIFVHQPMPPQIDAQCISTLIDPLKDIEGIHPQNMARRFFAKARIGSCTALAVMRLIEETGVDLEGKEAVVIGHSEIVGRPVSMLLLDKLATTTICHIGTDKAGRLEEHVRRADVLIVAAGQPELIKGTWIKPGAIVIDVGINVRNKQVIGDVEFAAAKERAGFITPVPGGVGPVTVMMVMKNTLEAFKLQRGVS